MGSETARWYGNPALRELFSGTTGGSIPISLSGGRLECEVRRRPPDVALDHEVLIPTIGWLSGLEPIAPLRSSRANTGDPATVASQVNRLKERFGLSHVALVGDRGMLTKASLKEDVIPAELDFITALRAPSIKALVQQGAIQLSLFDEMDLFEVTHPDRQPFRS
ncbi:MAG: hypothetical protein M0008_01360 [Actinomycetota bacterium]|nr:hypothetical protein [Actinomycetota bacterium]